MTKTACVDIDWPLAASSNWYDLSFTSDRDATWLRRLAGHVETGAASTSDPAFGISSGRIFGSGFE